MKRVLVCPLNWGLGHATRDVEIIDKYLKQGYKVIIGADKAALQFLRQHYPHLAYIVMPSLTITYSGKIPFMLKMLMQFPKMLFSLYNEHQLLKKIIKQYKIDIVVSDNRFGLWNRNVHSIFITHQLGVKIPKIAWVERFANFLNHKFINKFDECWIPDFEGNKSIAGELSHPKRMPKNAKYIGILSRFKDGIEYAQEPDNKQILSRKFDILALISGPEPQRSIFERIVVEQASKTNYSTLILQGKPEQANNLMIDNIQYINHLDSNNLKKLIQKTDVVICRSGYSSIMDFVVLGKKAVILATPGQTEQEYLAKYLSEKGTFYFTQQSDFDLSEIMKRCKNSQIVKT